MTLAAILKTKGHDVASMRPTSTIAEVVAKLAERGIGAVLVEDTLGQILGIVSERDIVRALAVHGAATLTMTAGQLMTARPVTAAPGISVATAMQIMTDGRFRHLPVMENGKLIGIVSIGDVVKSLLAQQAQEVDSLKAYVAGAM
ncbi:MAG: CBS domain-containing protein [Acidibrevibacterium sp.]|jgi:CBS domain-containing protein|uniref:CBS domain-containing protein n=1 Tax=Acidibrevibacterium fodinaquatile TaxID=1969806 RepID=UPI0023A7DA7C|nr:CBS domain-containing protein [Acidibrevibacterium fodinaquatile]MCA7121045.1 CBS domain-containing protein [Acidibrevibacterium fodinaquatile]